MCPANSPAYFDEGAYPQCFDETWDTKLKRRQLWGSVRTNVPAERRVSRILLSRIADIVAAAGPGAAGCSAAGTATLRATLREAHAPAVGVEVFALFAVSDAAFSEADKVPDVAAWNQYCAKCPNERFDGVAINNEHFTSIKCDADGSEEALLDRLWDAKLAATAGGLPLHMSLGWHWGWCSVGSAIANVITWAPPGDTPVAKPANEHFMDVLDSFDVQVAWNEPATMADRAIKAGYNYAATAHPTKPFFVLAYTNPSGSDCRTTFFPTVGGCTTGDLTEAGMWAAFDAMVNPLPSGVGDPPGVPTPVPTARGGIHYYRGVYNTGFTGWPHHPGGNVLTKMCAQKRPFAVQSGSDPTVVRLDGGGSGASVALGGIQASGGQGQEAATTAPSSSHVSAVAAQPVVLAVGAALVVIGGAVALARRAAVQTAHAANDVQPLRPLDGVGSEASHANARTEHARHGHSSPHELLASTRSRTTASGSIATGDASASFAPAIVPVRTPGHADV